MSDGWIRTADVECCVDDSGRTTRRGGSDVHRVVVRRDGDRGELDPADREMRRIVAWRIGAANGVGCGC